VAKRGRPPKPKTERKSVPIGARVTSSLHDKIIAAAAESGWKVSQEIEARLRLSFDELENRKEEFGGPMNYWFFRAISRGFRKTETASGHQWWNDRPTFEFCAAFLKASMERLKPWDQKISKAALRDVVIGGEELAEDMLFKLKMALSGEGEDLGSEIFNMAGAVGTKMNYFSPREVVENMRKQGLITTDEEAKSLLKKFKSRGLDKRSK
jgi:hypothetical protein